LKKQTFLEKQNIYVGINAFDAVKHLLNKKKYKNAKLFVLVDSNTLQNCLPYLSLNVPGIENAEIIEVEPGEASKNIEIAAEIIKTLLEYQVDRNAILINLGGGMITDLGGFTASIYKRGINFINIPTSLMGMIDASIGGKNGVNISDIKNVAGTFNLPVLTAVYPGFLRTLPKKELISGIAEMIKHAAIADEAYFNCLLQFDFNEDLDYSKIIKTSIEIKCHIVSADFNESNIRKTLNFGHTIGHAIESYFIEKKENQLLHGEAVAAGMICESYLAYKKLKLSKEDRNKLIACIQKYFKAIPLDEIDFVRILEIMKNDKKNTDNKFQFALITTIGNCETDITCSIEQIIDALKFYNKVYSEA
jgi:3-dehydroquinate synthase